MKNALQWLIGRPTGLAFTLAIVLSQLPVAARAQWAADCGSLEHINGPFDYTSAADRAERLAIVEQYHFTREVEQLRGHNKCGNNRCQLAGDINYTLMAFPNHHRALLSMARYHLEGLNKTEGRMRFSAECYFDRAIRFRPNDATVHMIFGSYLYKVGDHATALKEFEKAVELAPDSAEANYNLGLAYADAKEYPKAREHARQAYELGFPLQGLKAKLKRVGEWEDDEVDMQANKE